MAWRHGPHFCSRFQRVPTYAADVAIGTVITILFELALRSNPEGPGIGRPSPILFVLEEAHRFLGEQAAATTRVASSRIAREGRKYGVGIMLVSQRPSELPDTALSQCGTVIALRLTNSADQSRIRAALPDSVEGLSNALPSLRTGEAIVSGEATELPARVLIDRPIPMPQSEDPSTGTVAATKGTPPTLQRCSRNGEEPFRRVQKRNDTAVAARGFDSHHPRSIRLRGRVYPSTFPEWSRVVLRSLPA